MKIAVFLFSSVVLTSGWHSIEPYISKDPLKPHLFEKLNAKHLEEINSKSSAKQIKLKIHHQDEENVLSFRKNDLFHPDFTVSSEQSGKINNITESIANNVSKHCYYYGKHGAIHLCDPLSGTITLNDKIYTIKSFSNEFAIKEEIEIEIEDDIMIHADIMDLHSDRRNLIHHYDSCSGGYWGSNKRRKTAYISLFVGISPRLQKYSHYDNNWRSKSEIPSLVAARINLLQQRYHNMGFDSDTYSEAPITFNFQLKHLHYVDTDSDASYTTGNEVRDYVNNWNLYDTYGPWSLGAMFMYGTQFENGNANYPLSDSGSKPDSICTFGCSFMCQVCTSDAYFCTDPEQPQNVEHEGGHNLGGSHDGCGVSPHKDDVCKTEPSIMCGNGYGYEIPKGLGCSYDEMNCCIENILDTNTCLDSPFDDDYDAPESDTCDHWDCVGLWNMDTSWDGNNLNKEFRFVGCSNDHAYYRTDNSKYHLYYRDYGAFQRWDVSNKVDGSMYVYCDWEDIDKCANYMWYYNRDDGRYVRDTSVYVYKCAAAFSINEICDNVHIYNDELCMVNVFDTNDESIWRLLDGGVCQNNMPLYYFEDPDDTNTTYYLQYDNETDGEWVIATDIDGDDRFAYCVQSNLLNCIGGSWYFYTIQIDMISYEMDSDVSIFDNNQCVSFDVKHNNTELSGSIIVWICVILVLVLMSCCFYGFCKFQKYKSAQKYLETVAGNEEAADDDEQEIEIPVTSTVR